VNIKDNDCLISIIHKGSQTLISNNQKRETPSLVNGALDCFLIEEPRGKVGAKHLLKMNIFVWISPCVMINIPIQMSYFKMRAPLL
jgi:hypothetical protein